MGLIGFIARRLLDLDDTDMEDFDDFDDNFGDDADVQDAEDISFTGRKICATRHGCTGTTNCDSSYGAPIGR